MWALQITHFNISDERKFLPNPLRRHNDIVWLKLIQIIIESNCLSVNSSFEGCQPHKLTLTIPKLNRKIIPSQEPPESREKERKKKVNVLVLKKKRDIINFLRYKCIWLEYLLFVISFHVCSCVSCCSTIDAFLYGLIKCFSFRITFNCKRSYRVFIVAVFLNTQRRKTFFEFFFMIWCSIILKKCVWNVYISLIFSGFVISHPRNLRFVEFLEIFRKPRLLKWNLNHRISS